MQLNLKTDYSLRLMLYLTLHPGELSTVGEVAAAYRISAHHLSKVAQALCKAGFIELVRGRGGGMRLALNPAQIQLGAVVHLTEGPLPLLECFDAQTNTCVISPACGLKLILREAQAAFFATLENYTVVDVAGNAGALRSLLHGNRKRERRAADSAS
jgi:Rrf2 family nitric oxide-sensitive transcriptional repressor